MELMGVHHVSINVEDLEASLAFYVGTLGMVARSDRPDFSFGGAWLNVGEAQLHLICGRVPAEEGQHFALQVADLDETIRELRDNGVEVSDAVTVGPGRQAFTHDPSGNLLELHQVAAAATG